MSVTDDLVENNRAYAEGFSKGDLGRPPAKKLAVLACMDARLDPARALGLEEGDAHVIRNAGGVVMEPEIRALAISQHLLGTEEIVLLQHTDCAMLTFTDEEFSAKLEAETGERPSWEAGRFEDVEDCLRESLRKITESPFIPNKSSVRGFVYDVETGLVREVN